MFIVYFQRCCDLINECQDTSLAQDDVESIVQREMETMDRAIQDAVQKFTSMLEASRATDTGMQLEVRKILFLIIL